jgi:hypothetical protein
MAKKVLSIILFSNTIDHGGYVSRFLKLASGRRDGFVPVLIDWTSTIPTKAKARLCWTEDFREGKEKMCM